MKLLNYNGILSKRYALVAVFSILALLAFASSAMAGCCFLNDYKTYETMSFQDCSNSVGIDFFPGVDCSSSALEYYTKPLCCVINVSGAPQCYYGSMAYATFNAKGLSYNNIVCNESDSSSCIVDENGGCPTPAPIQECSPKGCLPSSSLFCTESGSIISNCALCGNCGGLVCNQDGICQNLGAGCTATEYVCCAQCADDNKQNITFNYDSNHPTNSDNCPSDAQKCCQSCPSQANCCEYSWQCSDALSSIDTCAGTNCGSACAEPQCVLGQKINSGLNTNPACWCDGIEKNTADEEYCCLFGPSNIPCEEAALSVYGKITDADTNANLSDALVIVDGEGVASSKTGADGKYQINGLSTGGYNLVAYAPNYYITSKTVSVGSSPVEVNFKLQSSTSAQCSPSSPTAVTGFNATHAMQGKVNVKLYWDQKCQQMISAYYLKRNDSTSLKLISPSQGEYIDSYGLKWNTSYKYTIWAVYKSGTSSPNSTIVFRTGSALCEGVYAGDEFCAEIVNGKMKKNTLNATLRRTCDNQNQLSDKVKIISTSDVDGYETDNCTQYYTQVQQVRTCALTRSANGEVLSRCILSGVCENSGNPFGLFYSQESCSPDTCFYDFSRTTVDSCNSCMADLACSEFISADACKNNACGLNCTWKYTNPELSKGICYSQTGNESSCDSCNSIFSGCTEEDCSRLGSCMMKNGICSSCTAGGITSCANYTTQYACDGKSSSKADFEYCKEGQLLSNASTNDACNMLRCAWNGTTCVKDGNYDGKDDCSSLGPLTKSECMNDNVVPVTSVTEFKYSPSEKAVYFNLSANKPVSSFTYCISKDNTCCPYLSQNEHNTSLFNLRIDLQTAGIRESGLYYLRYYSTDRFNNQETIRTYQIQIVGQDLSA
ncbi:MAG: carboxypeptidase-like regulatory domain-containing protein, partial [Candidatus Woesearchaeota archaeon]|nr:carboxypeptidase-like regulatory domain-containing protein [Candidatus Woesearchaeota archaeon]